MNFRKLIEDECNRVNPIVQLAACFTRDHAQQESIGDSLASNQMEENAMLPQSFNMNEIMTQIQGIESQNAAMQSSRGDAHIWAADYHNQIMQPDQNSFLNMTNTPLHGQNEVFENFVPIEEQHFEGSLNDPLAPVYTIPPCVEYFLNTFEESNWLVPLQPQETPLDVMETEEHEDTILKSEDDVPRKSAYLHYRGLSVEDVTGTTDLGVEFTETENFYNFVENYVIKYNGKNYEKCHPRSIPTNFKYYFINQMPSTRTAKRLPDDAVGENNDSFCMPYNEDSTENSSLLKELCDGLIKNEQYLDAIKVLEDIISLQEDDCLCIYQLADLYLREHCFYQACQTLFNWFKNDPDYMDIVPPNFTMKDKDDGTIDKNTLEELKTMFIKAAQRCPVYPDFRVQMALAKLCQVDRDYDKSVDCMQSVLTNKEFDQEDCRFLYLMKCLGNNLSLSNKPCYALIALRPINRENSDAIDVLTKMGLICLHKKRYDSACRYLLDVVERLSYDGYKESEDNLLVNSWTRLRLCYELIGNEDLCEMVNQRDLNALRNHISLIT